MKRKSVIAIVLFAVTAVCLFALTACGEKECSHSYSITKTKEATCTKKGYNTYTCSLCQDRYNEDIATAPHTEVTVTGVAPTCSAEGLSDGKYCTVCETVTVPQEVLPAIAHTYLEAATFNDVQHYFECSACGAKKGEAYHISSGKATLTTDEVCTVCGYLIRSLKNEMANFTYNVTDTTCEITGVKDITIKEITVPDIVTSIAFGAFQNCTTLERIALPFLGSTKGATENAFLGYVFGAASPADNATHVPRTLTNVSLTGGTVGDGAFANCGNLLSITIPLSAETIGEGAFLDCVKIVEIINHSPIEIAKDSYGLSATEVHNGTSKIARQGDYLFYTYGKANYLIGYAGTGTELTLPQSYNDESYAIHNRAFYKEESIVSVAIPDSLKTIGSEAFYFCTSLERVTLGKDTNLQKISVSAFRGCKSLLEFTIPATVTGFGGSVFRECSSLHTVTFAEGSQVETIVGSAFNGCTSLKNITLPGSLNQIKDIHSQTAPLSRPS